MQQKGRKGGRKMRLIRKLKLCWYILTADSERRPMKVPKGAKTPQEFIRTGNDLISILEDELSAVDPACEPFVLVVVGSAEFETITNCAAVYGYTSAISKALYACYPDIAVSVAESILERHKEMGGK